jgi:uncharacterized protein (TIGR02996 family)
VSHTSDDGAALLRAIREHPDEDTPRLVYADWLDERGGESNGARAELIRIQIPAAQKARRKNLRSVGLRISTGMSAHEHDLIRRFVASGADGWRDDLPVLNGVRYDNSSVYERFERGFPWQVLARDVDTLLAVAPELFEKVPITYLHLEKLTIKTARVLAESPHLARIRQWQDVYARRTDKMLEELARSEHLGNLREIDLTGTEITAAGVRALLFAPSIRSVTRLTFPSCELGDAGAEVIAASPVCAALEHLNLGLRAMSATGVGALVRAPFRLSMRSLVLTRTDLDDGAGRALAGAEWPRLEYLILESNRITDRGAAAFLDSPFWRGSECELWLSWNPLSDTMKAQLRETFGPRVRV